MIIWLFLAIISNLYFVLLQLMSPASFFGAFFSFSAVWFWISVVCMTVFVFRKKHLWRKIPAIFRKIFYFFLFTGIIISTANFYFITHPKLSDGSENPEYVILLGGGITKNAELSKSVQQRIKLCALYLNEHPQALCVVTGGKLPFAPCPESDVLKPALESCGIASERILAEDKSRDTIQNFQFSVRLISEYTGKSVEEVLASPVTIITNDFHIARAERLARRMGFSDYYGLCARTPFIFKANSYFREIFCYIKLNLRIIFTRKPERL